MGTNKCVAFLDILGFSNHMKSKASQSQSSTIAMLRSINDIFDSSLRENAKKPWHAYDEKSQPMVKRSDIDSFENFLPMSDSIFITGRCANDFIDQLSSFLYRYFIYTATHYIDPESKEAPELVTSKEFNHLGACTGKQEVQWYPQIFRGGVSYGEAELLQVLSLVQNEAYMSDDELEIAERINWKTGVHTVPNITGPGVVKAVELEKSGGKGPKLYLSDELINEFDENHKALIAHDGCGPHFLWPAYSLDWFNEIDMEISNACFNILLPAINLYKAYKNKRHGHHYYEFVRLIIDSFIAFAKLDNNENIALEMIREFLSEHDMSISYNSTSYIM